jgi:hypothetical protein
MAGDFFLLWHSQRQELIVALRYTYLLKSHAILHEQCYSRIKIANVLFQHKVLLGLR